MDTKKSSILVVDDEPDILFSLEGLLRREFDFHTAKSGAEALKILEQHPIHVIITDQRMPEMTGSELIGRVKSQYPDAIRIVFTGYSDIKAVIEAINSGGVYRYLTKPWDPDELVEVLHEAAATYHRLVERGRFERDVAKHLTLERELINKINDVPEITKKEIEDFIEANQQLIHRLEHLIREP